MPELDDSNTGLLYGSVNIGNGYVLLRKRAKNAVIPRGDEATAISHFLGPEHVLPLSRTKQVWYSEHGR